MQTQFNYDFSYGNSLSATIIGDGFKAHMHHDNADDDGEYLPMNMNKGSSITIINKWIYNIQHDIHFEKEMYKNDNRIIFWINSENLILGDMTINVQKFKDTILSFLGEFKKFSCENGNDELSIIRSNIAAMEKNMFPVIVKLGDNYHVFSSADHVVKFTFLKKEELIKLLDFCDNNLSSVEVAKGRWFKESGKGSYIDECNFGYEHFSGYGGYDISTYRANLAKEIREKFAHILN
jgi:hypothetical protein